jgi:geranylgeranyl diphosphate synthase type II
MIHTYSLIHDDLPCMDNDDYRRGRLTCHKVYGEDLATLAGDALQPAAFRVLSQMKAPADRVLRCISILAGAAGEHGMVAGQVLDLAGEQRRLTQEELQEVHLHKTGDMIRAACQMGTVLGGGSENQITSAGEFAEHLGLAFQIRDDMLDEIGTQEELGKPIGSDLENGKSTFVSLLGLDACQSLVEKETLLAVEALKNGGFLRTDFLEELALRLVRRNK